VAEKIRSDLPPTVETDDLMSAGIFGLVSAMERFDPSQGVKFSTFCTTRLRGAMLDELRALDVVPRTVRGRAKLIEKRYEKLVRKLNRAPTDEELAEASGMGVKELMTTQQQSAGSGPLSLTSFRKTDGSTSDWALEILQDKKAPEPSTALHREEVRDLVNKVIRSLPRVERLIVLLYYYEQFTMRQVGDVLSLSESRVSQIHSDVIRRLRQRLKAYKEDFFGQTA